MILHNRWCFFLFKGISCNEYWIIYKYIRWIVMNHSTQIQRNQQSLLSVLRKNLLLIVICTIIFGLLGWGTAKFVVSPQYSSQIQILVSQKNNSKETQPNAVQQADVQMINTYKDLITSRKILVPTIREVKKEDHNLSKNYTTVNYLRQIINVSNKPNSQIFSVNVKTSNSHDSAVIANSLGHVFKDHAKELMHTKNVTVVSWAVAPDKQIFPNTKLFIIAGALLGLILSFLYVTVRALYWSLVSKLLLER